MKVLVVRQPWAWLLIHGGKDIENRDWYTRYCGPLAIAAAKGMTRAEYDDAVAFVGRVAPDVKIPPPNELLRGMVIGTVLLVGCVLSSESPWFQGGWGFKVDQPKAWNPPIPIRGQLGIFDWEPPQVGSAA